MQWRDNTVAVFRTDYQMKYSAEHGCFMPEWQSDVAMDMSWVGSARAIRDKNYQWTEVIMAGASFPVSVDCPYEQFMEAWMKARANATKVR